MSVISKIKKLQNYRLYLTSLIALQHLTILTDNVNNKKTMSLKIRNKFIYVTKIDNLRNCMSKKNKRS